MLPSPILIGTPAVANYTPLSAMLSGPVMTPQGVVWAFASWLGMTSLCVMSELGSLQPKKIMRVL